jgi:uncharacterized protein YegP (UPF0339 family)
MRDKPIKVTRYCGERKEVTYTWPSTEEETEEMKPRFEFYKGEDGLPHWRLRAGNGEIVIPPEGYEGGLHMAVKTVKRLPEIIAEAEMMYLDGYEDPDN